jgi:hypothetical protein
MTGYPYIFAVRIRGHGLNEKLDFGVNLVKKMQ